MLTAAFPHLHSLVPSLSGSLRSRYTYGHRRAGKLVTSGPINFPSIRCRYQKRRRAGRPSAVRRLARAPEKPESKGVSPCQRFVIESGSQPQAMCVRAVPRQGRSRRVLDTRRRRPGVGRWSYCEQRAPRCTTSYRALFTQGSLRARPNRYERPCVWT